MSERPSITTFEEVMFFDTDCGGVVHNLAYLRMIEVNRTRLGVKMGLSMGEMTDKQLFPVVVKTEADYIRPGKLGDIFRIEGHLRGVTRSKLLFEFSLFRDGDGTLLLKAKQTLALVSLPAGRPLRIPEDWRRDWLIEDE